MSATPKVDAFEAAQSKGQDYQDLERDYIALLALARELERNQCEDPYDRWWSE